MGHTSDAHRTAILNGFGRTLGDGIIGLQALSVVLEEGAVPPSPVLFRLPGLPPVLRALYRAADFAAARSLPWEYATREQDVPAARRFGRIIDLRDFAHDAGFLAASMIDFFFVRLGVDPASIAPARRRNLWLARRMKPPDAAGARVILVCPRAAGPLRAMPPEIHARICDFCAEVARGRRIITQGAVPPGLAGRVRPRPTSGPFAALCALVAAADWVVATDTAMVHLADAFDVPCLAFFPTHDPAWRVRDYPHCTPVRLPSALPAGIEFARDGSDLTQARAAWFPHGDDLGWLDRALASAFPG